MPRSPELNARMRERTVAAIQRAALQLFASRGFHAASIAAIARRARVAKGLVYNYFRSKDDLLVAIVRDRLRAATVLDTAATDVASAGAAARLRQHVVRGTERALRDPELYRVYFGLLLQPDMAPVLARVETALGEELRAEVARLAALFGEVSNRPDLDVTLFQMALNGLALTLLVRPDLLEQPEAFPLPALQDRLVALFLRTGAEAGSPNTATDATRPRATRRRSTP